MPILCLGALQMVYNVMCEGEKIKLRIKREKVPLFHLDELSNYYFSRFTRKINKNSYKKISSVGQII